MGDTNNKMFSSLICKFRVDLKIREFEYIINQGSPCRPTPGVHTGPIGDHHDSCPIPGGP